MEQRGIPWDIQRNRIIALYTSTEFNNQSASFLTTVILPWGCSLIGIRVIQTRSSHAVFHQDAHIYTYNQNSIIQALSWFITLLYGTFSPSLLLSASWITASASVIITASASVHTWASWSFPGHCASNLRCVSVRSLDQYSGHCSGSRPF